MIFKNILLAYQLENYKNLRFLKFIYSHPKFWITWSKRQTLEYTSKAKLILILALILCVFDIFASIYFLSGIYEILSIIAVLFFLPLYFVAANIVIVPLDRYLKSKIISDAKKKIATFKDLKIIAITGSMGKTTTKEFLYTILSEKYNVLATEGTKNTPLWISRLIQSKLTKKHEIFIVEMWAYEKWNIAELCDIAQPDISIITGITLQHLERFGGLREIIDTKFEILESLPKNGFAVVDSSTEWVQRWLKEKDLDIENIIEVKKWTPFSYRENLWGIEFELEWKKIQTKILSNYIIETLQICWEVSKHIWLSLEQFQTWSSKIDFVEHRMQLIYNPNGNVYVIDDSFNGNIEWIHSILHLMKHAPFSGRKVLIAWWVVELWDETHRVNSNLWEQMAESSDLVLLVEWPVWSAILDGLKKAHYPENNIKMYQNPLSLHDDLKNITKNGDMIIFQNDLPDHYL